MKNLSTLGNKSHSSQKNQINYVIITLQDSTRILVDVNTYHAIAGNIAEFEMNITNIDRFNNKFKYVLRAIKRNNKNYYCKQIKKKFKEINFGGINSKHTPSWGINENGGKTEPYSPHEIAHDRIKEIIKSRKNSNNINNNKKNKSILLHNLGKLKSVNQSISIDSEDSEKLFPPQNLHDMGGITTQIPPILSHKYYSLDYFINVRKNDICLLDVYYNIKNKSILLHNLGKLKNVKSYKSSFYKDSEKLFPPQISSEKIDNIINRYGDNSTFPVPTNIKEKIKEISKNEYEEDELNLIIRLFNSAEISRITPGFGKIHTNLCSTYLQKLFGKQYKSKIVKLLENNIIKLYSDKSIGRCRAYMLTDEYSIENSRKKKSYFKNYKIKTKKYKQLLQKLYIENIAKTYGNVIAKNLIMFDSLIDYIPTAEDFMKHGKTLHNTKDKYGRVITYLGKKSSKEIEERDKKVNRNIERVYVEKMLIRYKHYVLNGLSLPVIPSSAKSGGRVFNWFIAIPAWSRELFIVDGDKLLELDFSALHPNIAISMYSNYNVSVTHQEIAEYLNMDVYEVKKLHLKFFNDTINNMLQSKLFKYYYDNHKEMLENIIIDKLINGYNITSLRLLTKEVEIMENIIKKLNDDEIYVGYVYDALYVKESDYNTVKQIMNETIKEFGINTFVK